MRLGLSRLRIAKDGDWPGMAAIGRLAVGWGVGRRVRCPPVRLRSRRKALPVGPGAGRPSPGRREAKEFCPPRPLISHETLPMSWDPYWHWLATLTAWLGRYALLAALVGSAAGFVLWLAGSRFSRSLVTLLAVTVGAVLGMHLPGWFDWPIEGMGLAVGGAMVLGLSGFLLHNTWVGLSLSGLS